MCPKPIKVQGYATFGLDILLGQNKVPKQLHVFLQKSISLFLSMSTQTITVSTITTQNISLIVSRLNIDMLHQTS